VYFYAQKNSSYSAQGPIPFEVAVVNIGDALDLESGMFTAPVSGVYFFSFDAYSNSGEGHIHLQKNGVNVGQSYDYNRGAYGGSPSQQLHLASILQLDAGDEIEVHLASGRIYEDGNSHYTHFTGMLLSDDVL
jgi:C1q domain